MKKTKVPSDIDQMVTVTRYELTRYLRGKKILVMLGLISLIFLLFITLPPLLGKDYPADSRDFCGQFLNFANILVILAATFFGADALVGEFQQRTAYLIFPNPLKRWVIFGGKLIASFGMSAATISLFYILAGSAVGIIDGNLPVEMAFSFGIALLYTFSALSVAYLVSAYLKNTVSSAVLTFFLFFLILPIIDSVLTLSQVKPWFSLTFSAGTTKYIIMNPYPVDSSIAIPMGKKAMAFREYYPVVATSIGVMLSYAAASIALALYRFNKKDV